MGGSIIKPLSENESEMTLIIQLDLGGSIPAAVLKIAATNGPLTICQLRNFAPKAIAGGFVDTEALKEAWQRRNVSSPKAEIDSPASVKPAPKDSHYESLANQAVREVLIAVNSQDWKFVKEVDGVRIFSKETGNDRSTLMKGETEMDAKPEEVLALIFDYTTKKEWDAMLNEWKIVEDINPTTCVRYELYYGVWVSYCLLLDLTFVSLLLHEKYAHSTLSVY